MHVRTDRIDRGALPGIEARRQQPRQAGLRPVFGQAEHLTVHEVRQHRVELLRLAAVNLVRAQVPGTTAGPVGVPLAQERVLCAPGFPPTDAMADRRMRCRHRLTVHPDLLSQASRHSGLRVGERDRFRADAALPTPHPTLRIDQRDRMRSPGQIVPRPIARRPHTPGPPTAATAAVAPASSALDPDRHPAVNGLAVTLGRHDPEPRQPQNPRTIPLRSHRSSLVVCTSREDGTGWSGVRGIALRTRPPSRPPQERGPRRRPGPQRKCVYSNRRRAYAGHRRHGPSRQDLV